VRGDGTKPGAENGVATAAMLALAENSTAPHRPLELLMTVTEEVGIAGAAKLAPELITGRVLLNLDSEEDATFAVGVDSIKPQRDPARHKRRRRARSGQGWAQPPKCAPTS
jgi:di/tripeptidase